MASYLVNVDEVSNLLALYDKRKVGEAHIWANARHEVISCGWTTISPADLRRVIIPGRRPRTRCTIINTQKTGSIWEVPGFTIRFAKK